MNIIIFGTGQYYKKYKSLAFEKSSVVALVDNNSAKQGAVIDGVPVIAPDKISSKSYDYIVLLLAYIAAAEVKKQLLSLGVDERKSCSMTNMLQKFVEVKRLFIWQNLQKK